MLGSEFCSGGEEENAGTDELGLSGNEVEGDERQIMKDTDGSIYLTGE